MQSTYGNCIACMHPSVQTYLLGQKVRQEKKTYLDYQLFRHPSFSLQTVREEGEKLTNRVFFPAYSKMLPKLGSLILSTGLTKVYAK